MAIIGGCRRRRPSWSSAGGSPASATGWASARCSVKPNEAGLNGWVKIARDDSVVVAMPRAEMGQGVHTALAMLVAEEMDARWDQVRVEDPPERRRLPQRRDPDRRPAVLAGGRPAPSSISRTGWPASSAACWASGDRRLDQRARCLGCLRIAGAVARELLLRRRAARPACRSASSSSPTARSAGAMAGGSRASASWSTSSATCRRCRRRRSRSRRAVQADRHAAPRLDIPAKVDGRRASASTCAARTALCRGAAMRRPSAATVAGFNGQRQPAQGCRRRSIDRAGRHRRHRHELVACRAASRAKALEVAVADRRPEPKLDSATLVAALEGLMQDGKPALTRTLGEEQQASDDAADRGDLSRALPRARDDGADELHRAGARGRQASSVWMPNQLPTLMRLAGGASGRRVAGRRHGAHDLPRRRLRPARRGRPRRPGGDLRAGDGRTAGAAPLVARRDIRHDFYRPWRWRAGRGGSTRRACAEAGERRQDARSGSRRPTSLPRARSACRRRASPRATPSRTRPTRFRTRLEAVVADGGGAGRLLALGRPFAQRLLRRELHRRAGARAEEGPARVPPRAAGRQAAPSQVLEPAAQGGRLGPAAAGRPGARHRAARLVRLDRGAGRRGRRDRRQDPAGQARHLRHRLRPGGQPGDRRAQMESGIIFGLSAALYGEITLANGAVEQTELPRLRRRAPGRCAGDGDASSSTAARRPSAASASPARRRSRRRSPTRSSPRPATAAQLPLR